MFEIKIFKVLNNHHILEKQSAITVNFSSKQLLCSVFAGQNSAQKARGVHKTPLSLVAAAWPLLFTASDNMNNEGAGESGW